MEGRDEGDKTCDSQDHLVCTADESTRSRKWGWRKWHRRLQSNGGGIGWDWAATSLRFHMPIVAFSSL